MTNHEILQRSPAFKKELEAYHSARAYTTAVIKEQMSKPWDPVTAELLKAKLKTASDIIRTFERMYGIRYRNSTLAR